MPAEGSNPADPATTQPETEAEAEPNVADNSQHQLFPDGITPADDTEKQPEPEVTSSDKAEETPNATPEENHASETQTKEENTPAKTNSVDPIDQEQLDQKVKENVELQQKLESALSNQQAEREAFKNLTDENAKLQKHHDDMKEKFDEIQSEHFMTKAELETLRDVNNQQKDQISKLETEVRVLKETQGGDEVVKDLQEKLIRLSNEQEEKDKRIHSLEGQLDATEEKLKQAEAKADRNENAPKSKTCSIM